MIGRHSSTDEFLVFFAGYWFFSMLIQAGLILCDIVSTRTVQNLGLAVWLGPFVLFGLLRIKSSDVAEDFLILYFRILSVLAMMSIGVGLLVRAYRTFF